MELIQDKVRSSVGDVDEVEDHTVSQKELVLCGDDGDDFKCNTECVVVSQSTRSYSDLALCRACANIMFEDCS